MKSEEARKQVKDLDPHVVVKIFCGDGQVVAYDIFHDNSPASITALPADAAHAVEAWLTRHFSSESHLSCNKRSAHAKYLGNKQFEPCFCTWGADHG